MNHIYRTFAAVAILLAVVACGCTNENGSSKEHDSDKIKTSRGEHDRDGEEHGREGSGEHGRGEEGEESGTELALNDTYDNVRNCVRLILAFDAKSNSFKGKVENTSDKTLKRVRVEVHLSNGIELGPTIPKDLGPGEKRDIELAATDKPFKGWTAHPEVGSNEHGHGEGKGEHDG